MPKQAVIIFGPPGAGKGTQAELLARRYGFLNFDTGRYLENTVHSKEAAKDQVLKRERINFDTGKLCTPSFVLKIVKNETKKLASLGANIVYSGSPRTMYEAFGDEKTEGLMRLLEAEYGKRNVRVLVLQIPASASIARNSKRRVCSVCGLQVLANVAHPRCPLCDGKTKTRTLDDPRVIKERLKEYAVRTKPMIDTMKKKKYPVAAINGVPAPYAVSEKIAQILKLKK